MRQPVPGVVVQRLKSSRPRTASTQPHGVGSRDQAEGRPQADLFPAGILSRAASGGISVVYNQIFPVRQSVSFPFPEWARGEGILRRQRSQGAIKVQARGWKGHKGPECLSGYRPAYRTWDRKRSFAGLKHRLGRANNLPGVPWYHLRTMGAWKTRGRAQALWKGGDDAGNETEFDGDCDAMAAAIVGIAWACEIVGGMQRHRPSRGASSVTRLSGQADD